MSNILYLKQKFSYKLIICMFQQKIWIFLVYKIQIVKMFYLKKKFNNKFLQTNKLIIQLDLMNFS